MLANPVFQGTLLDLIQLENFRNDISILYKTIFVYFATIVFVQVIRMFKRFSTRKFAYDTSFNMRRIVYNNILNQTENELTNQKIGTLISRVTSDIDNAVEGMRKLVTEIFDTVLLFVVYLIYLFCFDIKITLLSVISVILGILLSFAFRKLNFKYSSLARKENAKLSSKTFDLFDHALLYR
ncbi:MAG TPA: ABC transporter ATP-binding protein, partial [Clostridiales bacterium]|nr:ABC transporter ATP-binding protein [Clostridiales bacterium]